MANRYRGAVEFEAGGKKHTFRLGLNELVELQDAMGITDDDEFLRVLARMRGLKQVRKVVAYAMRNGDGTADEQAAGDVITELGMQRVGQLIQDALKWAFPDPEPGGQRGKARSPGAPS